MQTFSRARALAKILAECERNVDYRLDASAEDLELLRAGEAELTALLGNVLALQLSVIRERELRRTLFDLVPTGLLFIDDKGVVRDANRAACELLGKDLCGRSFDHVVVFDDTAGAHAALDGMKEPVDLGLGLGAHQSVPVRVKAHPIHEGHERRVLVVHPTSEAERPLRDRLRPIQRAPLLGRARVLVVEHDRPTRNLLTRVLSEGGAHVLTAAGASEALAVVESFGLDVIVSDVALPRIDGYALIRRVRKIGCTMPAIALARRQDVLDITRANDAGFDTCIVHTSDYEALLQCVRRLVRDEGASTDGHGVARKISA
jgi:PAS domain S-box-containing protein